MSEEDIIELQMARENEENWWEELRASGECHRPRALAVAGGATCGLGGLDKAEPVLDTGRKELF